MMAEILSNPWMLGFYIVGVVSATFHLANGIWSFLVSWGITQSARSQQIATYVTLIIFLALSVVGVQALLSIRIKKLKVRSTTIKLRSENSMAKSKLIVVGGGLAGLMATMKAAEDGTHVDLFSLVPVKRSHSVCAQGGINGAVNTKGEGDSPAVHLDDTVYGGDFLANQKPVKAMADAAPGIISLFDRMGVMFNRTPEGLLDFRRFGGTMMHRTAFAGATTGQQLTLCTGRASSSF